MSEQIDNSIIYLTALKRIGNILDNLKYECCARQYTLDDDEMGWIFYCRDLAQDPHEERWGKK